ncbi:hypothetical protein [Streptomyces sp. SCL15-4]|uniref:hypothetical protein n=1 Tax=Streptomyces sp. SCL15-4 TaxID=2967221 RepID=UPI0029660477|nr:hypothetical protein [Streptomyces sp. SCL15-4]
MSRLARPAERLATGSVTVTRRLGRRAAAWVKRGYRYDLTGFAAVIGCWVRAALLVLGLYLLWRLVRAAPTLLWLLCGAWVVAAWRASKSPSEPAADTPVELDASAVRTMLLDLMGEGDAVHLRTVLAHLHGLDLARGWTVSDLRVRLEALGITVHPKVKVAGSKSPTRGVRRADLRVDPTLSRRATTETSTEASTAA